MTHTKLEKQTIERFDNLGITFSSDMNRSICKSFLLSSMRAAYEAGLHETAIKLDKAMIDWLKENTEGVKMIDEIKKSTREATLEETARENSLREKLLINTIENMLLKGDTRTWQQNSRNVDDALSFIKEMKQKI